MTRDSLQSRRRSRSRNRLRILVTAGPTREHLDPVRYLSNESSGKMGFAIAEEAARRGHAVTLVHGPVALAPPAAVRAKPIVSASDLLVACREVWGRQDVLIMAAAVADYRPIQLSATKLKKSAQTLTLRLAQTPDVVATLAAERREHQVIIGFALEDRDARRNARKKMVRKGLNAIVLNGPSALSADRSRIEILLADGGALASRLATKTAHAQTIVDLAERLAHSRP